MSFSEAFKKKEGEMLLHNLKYSHTIFDIAKLISSSQKRMRPNVMNTALQNIF